MERPLTIKWKEIRDKALTLVDAKLRRRFLVMSMLFLFNGRARPYDLRKEAEKFNLSYKSVLRGLNDLRLEGLVESEDNEYVLKEEAMKAIGMILEFQRVLEQEATEALEKGRELGNVYEYLSRLDEGLQSIGRNYETFKALYSYASNLISEVRKAVKDLLSIRRALIEAEEVIGGRGV